MKHIFQKKKAMQLTEMDITGNFSGEKISQEIIDHLKCLYNVKKKDVYISLTSIHGNKAGLWICVNKFSRIKRVVIKRKFPINSVYYNTLIISHDD